MSWMIKVEDLSKMYRLGAIGSSTLQDDFKRAWYKVRGKEDPFLKIGEENNRSIEGGQYVWALKDINFEVNQGEVLGIIGKNGAGKSTLLKLLSKVTKPSVGSIKSRGRIASLLEVGTGFHPELSGRENIFLNGAILGMKKHEIKAKFDEIVDFSGCERYIDTPVKRYSSGMYVRLAFAVAAHLEPEILVVDEVLAVGDAEFQKKAIGKMKDVSNSGRTVLFVSHNMASIEQLCNKALLLENGKIFQYDNVDKVVNTYFSSKKTAYKNLSNLKRSYVDFGKKFRFTKCELYNSLNKTTTKLRFMESYYFIIHGLAFENITNLSMGIKILNYNESPITAPMSSDTDVLFNIKKGESIKIKVDFKRSLLLSPGDYLVNLSCSVEKTGLDLVESCFSFKILNTTFKGKMHTGTIAPVITKPHFNQENQC